MIGGEVVTFFHCNFMLCYAFLSSFVLHVHVLPNCNKYIIKLVGVLW